MRIRNHDRGQTNLFVAAAHLSADAAEFFCLSQDRTLIMGSRIEVWCHVGGDLARRCAS